ncbi:hypothetical protein [Candidatus Entotheonella palauensis]|uniref:hypothetical protein n=1 Tax=Candidatus Entotheonella palauensis TaxID=93172 RepID=UPI001177A0FD|nr:hypothetical protein [Candidatus Entotheonella palauensis]
MTALHINAATLHLRIEAPDLPEYAVRLPMTTFDHVVMAPVGTARMFHLEVENHWGLAIYQSRPQMADLVAGEKLELSLHLQPIETILPLTTASVSPGRETMLTVDEEDSPLQDLRLAIPKDAFSQPLRVSLDEVYNATRIPAPKQQASVLIDIQPHHVRLTSPATLTFPYYQALVSRLQQPESHLRINVFDMSKQQWRPLARQVIDPDDNTVVAQLEQFGLFVLAIGEEPLIPLPMVRSEEVSVPTTPETPQDHHIAEAVVEDTGHQAIEAIVPSPPADTSAWRHERLSLQIRPHRHGPIGIMLRYQDDQFHYRFVWELSSQQAHLIKSYRGKRTVLASISLPYVASHAYPLHVVTKSDAITVSVDGKSIFDIRDSDIPSGAIALNCASEVSRCFDQVRIE